MNSTGVGSIAAISSTHCDNQVSSTATEGRHPLEAANEGRHPLEAATEGRHPLEAATEGRHPLEAARQVWSLVHQRSAHGVPPMQAARSKTADNARTVQH